MDFVNNYVKTNKGEPVFQQQEMCARTLVSGNIRFMRIFAVIHFSGEEVIKWFSGQD